MAENTPSALTRRSFLKTTGVVAGAAALGSLAGCAPKEGGDGSSDSNENPTAIEETVVYSTCMGNCGGCGCPLLVHVRDGKVCNLTKPRLEYPDGSLVKSHGVCMKGYMNIERMYSPTRVQYPMRRVDGTERGDGQWERVSWEEAIGDITSKWKEMQAESGNTSIAFMSGTGNTFYSNAYATRLATLMGAMTLQTAYDANGVNAHISHCGIGGYTWGLNEYRDLANAETILIWGGNPTESIAVDYHYITEAKEKGATVIVIDPVFTSSASDSDRYISIRPGSDGLLAAGMALIAIRDGKIDKSHMQKMTVAPFLVKNEDGLYLRLSDLGKAEAGSEADRILVYEGGNPVAFDEAKDPEIEGEFEIDGIAVKPAYQILLERFSEWDLETISKHTDISIETIEELADLWTSTKCMICTGFGHDHYGNGFNTYDAMFALSDITGVQCEHGRGIACCGYTSPMSQGIIDVSSVGLDDAVPGPIVPTPYVHQLVEEGKAGAVEADLRSIYIYRMNPVGNETDRQKWLKTLGEMELVVVSDMFMSETAELADYVLPAAFIFEHDDIFSINTMFARYAEKVVDPLFEAKGDFDIITLLGKGMGFEKYFTASDLEHYEACVTNDLAESVGLTWDKLKSEHAVFTHLQEPAVQGLNSPILSATGRFEFYHEGILPQFDDGRFWDSKRESCWYWEPPIEAWYENEKYATYPLVLGGERCKFKTHTMFNNSPSILELDPEPYVKINPVDASARGIAEGDVVRLYNDRGSVTLKAVFNAGCRPGFLVIDHGWTKDHFIDGHYADLTSCATKQRFAQDNWFDCLCEMEKVQ